MREIGVRALRERLSEVLAQVGAGQTVVITHHGQPVARIGTTQGDAVVLQDGSMAPISGWGWNDRGWATLGAPYTFAQVGAQTLRIQQREDGIRIDQIVISPVKYLTIAPGAPFNDATIVR